MKGTAKARLDRADRNSRRLGSERHHTRMVVAILRHIVSENLTRTAAISARLTITAAADRRDGWLAPQREGSLMLGLTINNH